MSALSLTIHDLVDWKILLYTTSTVVIPGSIFSLWPCLTVLSTTKKPRVYNDCCANYRQLPCSMVGI